MGEVLSQNEIDDLLSALNSGELDVDEYRSNANEKQIKDYDFARPSKFSKEQLRTLEIIFEHYARLISTTLPAYLRTTTQVDVVNSEAISYSEFANALSNPILLGVADFSPLKGSFVVDLSVNIGYAIIDRLLGGKGEPLDREREFSEIEVLLIEKILVICLQNMREPWKNVVELSPRLEKIETNSQFAQVISPTDVVALITLSMKIGPVEGLMNFCIPYLCLEPIMDKLNTKYWFSAIQDTNEELYKEIIENQINNVDIPIKAVLGESSISVNDFVNLQKGDIVKLSKKVDSEMEVYVGNIKKFKGKPGVFNNKNAIKITSIIREEE